MLYTQKPRCQTGYKEAGIKKMMELITNPVIRNAVTRLSTQTSQVFYTEVLGSLAHGTNSMLSSTGNHQ